MRIELGEAVINLHDVCTDRPLVLRHRPGSLYYDTETRYVVDTYFQTVYRDWISYTSIREDKDE